MSYLSLANFQYVADIAFKFLQDTKSLFVTADELNGIVAETMRQIAQSRDGEEVDLEAWNKQTILKVRDIVKSRNIKTPPMEVEETDASEMKADPFFTKLQELEVARKSGNVWMQSNASAAAIPLATPPVTANDTANNITTIYMQAPPEKGVTIHIRSWHRSWVQNPFRAAFTWSGPFPVGMDVNSSYVSCVIVPKQTMTWTPYVILEIEGAGGQVNECILIPDSKSVNTTWEYLRPSVKSLGYVKPLALPWKLRLLDADRESLPYGEDRWKVKDVQPLREATRIVIDCEPNTSLRNEFVAQELLLIRTSVDQQLRCKVVAVGPNTIDVDEIVDRTYIGANILHLHRQSCVIIETSTTTHVKK